MELKITGEEARTGSAVLFGPALDALSASVAILDPSGAILAVNSAWRRLGEATGFVLHAALVGDSYLSACHAATGDGAEVAWRLADGIREVAAGERVEFSAEYPCPHPVEQHFAVRVTRPPAEGHSQVVVVHECITARKQAEGVLGSGEARFRSLIENASDIITILDDEGTILYESPSAARVLGFDAAQRVGRSLFDFVCATDLSPVVSAFSRCLRQPGANVPVEYRCRHGDGSWRILEGTAKSLIHDPSIAGVVVNSREITERKRAEEDQRRLTAVMDSSPDFVGTIDSHGRFTYLNGAARQMLGMDEKADASGFNFTDVHAARANELLLHEGLTTALRDGVWTGETVLLDYDRREIPVLQAILAHKLPDGAVEFFSMIARDITERKRLEGELRQAQRLEAIGHLAAGIAHEINTPIQYVGDNIRFLEEGFAELAELMPLYQGLLETAKQGDVSPGRIEELESAADRMDLEYLLEEFPRAAAQSLEGVERVAEIVRAMKEFSHPGSGEKTPTDINRAILSTATVARSEWKYVAELVTDLDPTLSSVPCIPGDFNQALLNIIVNAAHAISDVVGDGSGGQGSITITTRRQDAWAEIRITDTGAGIPEAARSQIFDPFFTTKEVGRGTGQGLTLARSVVVDKHGGSLAFETEVGRGTTFIIRLPLLAAADANGEAAV